MKKTFIALLLLTVFSCTKEPANSPAISATQHNDAQKEAAHYIGERFGGGVIFFINSSGTHGLISDTADLEPAAWYNGTYTVTEATRTGVGQGAFDTKKVVVSQGAGSYAAIECARSKRSGYTDWFLPSKNEWYALYAQKDLVGGFTRNFYWSSTEVTNEIAWSLRTFHGDAFESDKSSVYHVRAIRAF